MSFISHNANKARVLELEKISGGGKAWRVNETYSAGSVISEGNRLFIATAEHISEMGDVANGSPSAANNTMWTEEADHRKLVILPAIDPIQSYNETMDMRYNDNFEFIASGHIHMELPINFTIGNRGTIVIQQNTSDTAVITWDPIFKFTDTPNTPPVLPTGTSGVMILNYYVIDLGVGSARIIVETAVSINNAT